MNMSIPAFGSLGAAASPLLGPNGPVSARNPGRSDQPSTADTSLVIRYDKQAAEYVYMTVSKTSGEILNQWPSSQSLKLQSAPKYRPGALVQKTA